MSAAINLAPLGIERLTIVMHPASDGGGVPAELRAMMGSMDHINPPVCIAGCLFRATDVSRWPSSRHIGRHEFEIRLVAVSS